MDEENSGECLFPDLGDFCVFFSACGWSSVAPPHPPRDGKTPEQGPGLGEEGGVRVTCCPILYSSSSHGWH